jgi:hypothetical protein
MEYSFYAITNFAASPTTPDPTPPMPLPFSGRNWQQPQQQVLLMLTPAVLKRLLNNAKGLHQR